VPAGRTGLQVVALTDSEAEVGRVLVHGETEVETEITVAPIVPETTVEGLVAVRLRVDGETAALGNTGGLSLFVRMGATTAASVAAEQAEIDAVADAYAAAEAYANAAAPEVAAALDAETRSGLLVAAAVAYALARDGGTGIEAAHEAFAEATLDAYAGAGADMEQVTLLTAARSTGAVAAAAAGSAATRLSVARQMARLNLRARARLASDVSGAPGSSGSASASALATARTQVDAATSLAEVRAALEDAADLGRTAVFEGIVSVTGELEAGLEAQVAAALEAALAEADLAARLSATSSAADAAQVLADYRPSVDQAVAALLTLLPDGASVDAGAVARLLVAANGNGDMSD
jgi:hypothetical protein